MGGPTLADVFSTDLALNIVDLPGEISFSELHFFRKQAADRVHTHWTALQHTALQRTALQCTALQRTALDSNTLDSTTLQCTAQ